MNELIVMPHDLQAEASVLGAIFINNEVLVTVQEHITYQDFYKHANQLIFKAFVELADKGDAIDATTVKNILETKGDLQRMVVLQLYSMLLVLYQQVLMQNIMRKL